ncbi:MAG: GNAT family N-acetyltransferase [Firmicutes bacterium]|nr:GNAT family N-acetyltransferase [Bacillota bacterium]
MIRLCQKRDFNAIYSIINNSAEVYKGVIPEDRWKEPYMTREELKNEIQEGVIFWGYELGSELVGVMGIQNVENVSLIRHAYVLKNKRNMGIGGALLNFLRKQTSRPIFIGTWADAAWAISFYKKHGFTLLSTEEKERLLRKYWSVPERQIESSVVLAMR